MDTIYIWQLILLIFLFGPQTEGRRDVVLTIEPLLKMFVVFDYQLVARNG